MRTDATFPRRLRDLLATIESSALVGLSAIRVRGLGDQLSFACAAMEADEAIAALETTATANLIVPVVADRMGHRVLDALLPREGTAITHVLEGGSALSMSVLPDDAAIVDLAPLFSAPAESLLALPIRLGERTVGAVGLVRFSGAFDDEDLAMAERLSGVVGLTVEAYFTERMLFDLFVKAMPDVLAEDGPTDLGARLAEYLRSLRLEPSYRRRTELAVAIGRIAARGPAEAAITAKVLGAFESYVLMLEGHMLPEEDP